MKIFLHITDSYQFVFHNHPKFNDRDRRYSITNCLWITSEELDLEEEFWYLPNETNQNLNHGYETFKRRMKLK